MISALHHKRTVKGLLILFLLFAACLPPGPEAAAQGPEQLQYLHDKAAAEGSVRVIVTAARPQMPDRMAMAPQQFDSLLADTARTAQSRVLDTLRPEMLVKAPVRFPYTAQFMAVVTAEGFEALTRSPDVVSISEDFPDRPLLDLSVPHIFPSHATSPYTGSGWAVAVLDTGVDKYHSFLAGKVVSEACYSANLCPGGGSSSTAPDSGLPCPAGVSGCDHGTHVAGIAAGSGETFDGVARNADLIAVQVFSRFDSTSTCNPAPAPCALTYTSDQILGLQRIYELRNTYAIASVNMSLGGGRYYSFCDGDSRKASIDMLKSAGIATVIASGNDGYSDSVSAPGCISTAITVGATNNTVDTRASFSNSGPQLDLYAPGVSIYSSIPGGGFSSKSGTSMATPHVAGAWAVLKEKYPASSVDDIETRFDNSGVAVTVADVTRQRIDVDEALGTEGGTGFTSVAPCRIVDTRVAGGMIPAGTSRHFRVYGSDGDIQAQGGTGDCGISWTSTAVMLNITSTGAAGTGNLRLYPYNSALPTASILNVTAGRNIANATLGRICQPSCFRDISVYSSIDSHVVIDVLGYME